MRIVFMIEARGRKRIVERVLLGIMVAAVGVAAPIAFTRVARVQHAADHWRRAEAFAHHKQWQEAETEFRASLRSDPTFFPARDALASLAWAREDFDACIREYAEAHRVDPRSPEPLVALGRVHFGRRDFAAAIPLAEKAVALDPAHGGARKLLQACRAGMRTLREKHGTTHGHE